MLFSCKITNSAIQYLSLLGADLEEVYAGVDLPEEFLCDPSYWLEADKMERFLESAQNLFEKLDIHEEGFEGSFAQNIGHKCNELRAWGVLDSVLRMMQKPQDVFAQPDRFISYFVSPPPPIASVEKKGNQISFDLPISAEEYPLVSAYLRSAVEAIPSYIGEPLAGVDWKLNHMQISWVGGDQESFFSEDLDPGRVIKPELAQSLVLSLEGSQRELERKNQELLLKNMELEKAKTDLERQIEEQNQLASRTGHTTPNVVNLAQLADTVAKEIEVPIKYLQEQTMRLSDYMGRAQQLITLLVGQGRKDKQISEAMRRMDWFQVQENYPSVIKNSTDALGRLKTMLVDLSLLVEPSQVNEIDCVDTDLNDLITRTLELLKLPSLVSLVPQLLLDRKVKVHPLRFEQALLNLLTYSLDCIGTEGVIKVRSMRVESTALIEVFNSSQCKSEEELVKDFSPFQEGQWIPRSGLSLPIAKSIIERHKGQLIVLTNKEGTKFVIQLPL